MSPTVPLRALLGHRSILTGFRITLVGLDSEAPTKPGRDPTSLEHLASRNLNKAGILRVEKQRRGLAAGLRFSEGGRKHLAQCLIPIYYFLIGIYFKPVCTRPWGIKGEQNFSVLRKEIIMDGRRR